ncbi:MAG: hypothetical protein HC919_02810 [Oscillatoriales cyanobacterium SM2_2_1]|nr:hypothetical protein [Oscillatoriales cyanobacterium SM2_2_1]
MMRINLILAGLVIGTLGSGLEGAIAQTARAAGVASLTSGSTIIETFDATTGNLTSRTVTNGVVTSVSGETNLPNGLFFGGNVNVTPVYGTISGGTTPVVSGLVINPGVVGVIPENATFSRAAAQILINSAADPAVRADLEEIAALIRTGAGVNGLD